MKYTFHLIANAHLDPVWLWDWREGLTEGVMTCRTILDLMDDDPDLTFVRGEAAIYRHIEQADPQTFLRIQRYVESGRWDVVGGSYIQPDTNLPATETFNRHFMSGMRYFESRFGHAPRVAWAADSFGHSAGLPEIMAAAGVEGFAFTRPDHAGIPSPAFWWEGAGGARVLAYHPPVGWYGTDRHEMIDRLNALYECARNGTLVNVGVFYGVGNHGGGPTKRLLRDIRAWASESRDVDLVHSGLHRFFDALKTESANLPVFRGELNFCLRGCYVSAAGVKFRYRHAEAAVRRSEKIHAAASALQGAPVSSCEALLRSAWDAVLFNSFHDILPGTSIERALEHQKQWLGGSIHDARAAEFWSIVALANLVDTTLPPSEQPADDMPSRTTHVLFNPHPTVFSDFVEIEAGLDYRPIAKYMDRVDELPLELRGPTGDLMPFQPLAVENDFSVNVPFRSRILTHVTLPPLGWSVLTFGYVEGAGRAVESTLPPAAAPAYGAIDNGVWRVQAVAGESGIRLWRADSDALAGNGLSFVTVEDYGGSWGDADPDREQVSLLDVRDRWSISRVIATEHGPERSALWIELTGGRSRLELIASVSRGSDRVDFNARLLWNERSARLKLVMPVVGAPDRAEYDIPGGQIVRGDVGEVPGGRWVRAGDLGFATDSLYGYNLDNGTLYASIARASRYAASGSAGPNDLPTKPACDAGELKFRFRLTLGAATAEIARLAAELEQPPAIQVVVPSPGALPRRGSVAAIAPETLELLALKTADDGEGFVIRVRETSELAQTPVESPKPTRAVLQWLGETLDLGEVERSSIASWRLRKTGDNWSAVRVDTAERPAAAKSLSQ